MTFNIRPTVIRPWLLLGGEASARNLDFLQSKGVRHVVNAADDVRNAFPDELTYLNLNLPDGHQRTGLPLAALKQTFAFVEGVLRNNPQGAVLVHCKAGVNRSAAVVVALLMYRAHLTFVEAVHDVEEKRAISILFCNEIVLIRLSRRLLARRVFYRYVLHASRSSGGSAKKQVT